MKIATFSTHQYDRQYLDQFNTGHEITYFEVPLNGQTVMLTEGFDAVCIFVNDHAMALILTLNRKRTRRTTVYVKEISLWKS